MTFVCEGEPLALNGYPEKSLETLFDGDMLVIRDIEFLGPFSYLAEKAAGKFLHDRTVWDETPLCRRELEVYKPDEFALGDKKQMRFGIAYVIN